MTQALGKRGAQKKRGDDDEATTEMKIENLALLRCVTHLLNRRPEWINGCSYILGLDSKAELVSYYFVQSDK